MIALYGLDEIGPGRNWGPERRPWVAKLLGLDEKRSYDRQFVEGSRDYHDADSRGRGTKLYFRLEPGSLYEVCRWRARYKDERFFVRVDATGEVVGIAKADVVKILQEAQCARDETIQRSLAALDHSANALSISTS